MTLNVKRCLCGSVACMPISMRYWFGLPLINGRDVRFQRNNTHHQSWVTYCILWVCIAEDREGQFSKGWSVQYVHRFCSRVEWFFQKKMLDTCLVSLSFFRTQFQNFPFKTAKKTYFLSLRLARMYSVTFFKANNEKKEIFLFLWPSSKTVRSFGGPKNVIKKILYGDCSCM